MNRRILFAGLSLLLLLQTGVSSAPLTKDNYNSSLSTAAKGVVLMDIDWGRYWRCGGHESAQLREIWFDRMPLADRDDDAKPAELLEGSSLPLLDRRGLQNHALIVEPGTYAMTRILIRITKSQLDIGYLDAKRGQLVRDGVAVAGTFRVGPGEVVYIGNFKLECKPPMTLWRYYTAGKEGFARHLLEFGRSFPFADFEGVRYRLFETKTIGTPYELN